MNGTINRHFEAISDEIRAIERAAYNQALDYVMHKVDERANLIGRLLDNGRDIIETTTGDRWRRLYDKRHELFVKKWELYEVENIIVSERYK